jgi:hypothetical protein
MFASIVLIWSLKSKRNLLSQPAENSVAADGQKTIVGWQKLSATAKLSRYTACNRGFFNKEEQKL